MGLRLNLGCGTDVRLNYLNIDRIQTHPQVIVGDFTNLANVAPACVEEIIAVHCIQYVPFEQIQSTLGQWASKLEQGGTLYIESTDCNMISTMLHYDQAALSQMNQVLYGPSPDRPVGLYNLSFIQHLLRSLGLEVMEKGYNGPNFYIRVKRA